MSFYNRIYNETKGNKWFGLISVTCTTDQLACHFKKRRHFNGREISISNVRSHFSSLDLRNNEIRIKKNKCTKEEIKLTAPYKMWI